MKRLTFILCVLCATTILSCTKQNSVQYTYQIPDSLIIDADTATIIPAYQKKIGDTKVVCYIIDSCRGKYDGKLVLLELHEVGNKNFTSRKVRVEKDSFVVEFKDVVGTSMVGIDVLDFSRPLQIFIEPNDVNKVWIDLSKSRGFNYFVYSDNKYNSINHAHNLDNQYYTEWLYDTKLKKNEYVNVVLQRYDSVVRQINQNDSCNIIAKTYFLENLKYYSYAMIQYYNSYSRDFLGDKIPFEYCITASDLNNVYGRLKIDPAWVLYLDSYDSRLTRDDSLNLECFSEEIFPLVKLSRLCGCLEKMLWKNTSENAADSIDDDFCVAAYKHYRNQALDVYTRKENSVYVEHIFDVEDEMLLSSIIQKYQGKRVVVDFWGTRCGWCVREIRANEAEKENDRVYLYITCPFWSSEEEWNKMINNIRGYHYFISNEEFKFILNEFDNKSGSLPFKIYYSADGKLEKTQIGYKPQ